jgi:alpha-L-rhamnosidase
MLITNVIVYLGMIKKDRCMLQGFVFLALLLNTLFVNATPVQLSCEHLVNPVGIDAAHPRFSWQLIDNDKGATQTAYQLMIGTDPNKLSFWDSKKINAGAQLITYNGKALQPFTKYYWVVKVWNKAGRESMSAIAFFETGMMSMENWKGSWVTDTKDINLKQAAYFRKTFISSKKITSARAYIAAAGLYELSVNGNRIGDHRLDPMYTRFDRRTLYVTYDVTKQLQDGKNTVGILISPPPSGTLIKHPGGQDLLSVWICAYPMPMVPWKR